MLAPRTAWGLPMPSASHDSPGRAPRACAPCGAAPSRPSEPGGESTSRSTLTVPFSGVTEASAAPDPVSAASASPATPGGRSGGRCRQVQVRQGLARGCLLERLIRARGRQRGGAERGVDHRLHGAAGAQHHEPLDDREGVPAAGREDVHPAVAARRCPRPGGGPADEAARRGGVARVEDHRPLGAPGGEGERQVLPAGEQDLRDGARAVQAGEEDRRVAAQPRFDVAAVVQRRRARGLERADQAGERFALFRERAPVADRRFFEAAVGTDLGSQVDRDRGRDQGRRVGGGPAAGCPTRRPPARARGRPAAAHPPPAARQHADHAWALRYRCASNLQIRFLARRHRGAVSRWRMVRVAAAGTRKSGARTVVQEPVPGVGEGASRGPAPWWLWEARWEKMCKRVAKWEKVG